MFITSFIPLWISISFCEIWNIVVKLTHLWNEAAIEISVKTIIKTTISAELVVLAAINIVVLYSIFFMNHFIKKQTANIPKPRCVVQKSTKEKRLSSEFLLAYILPMIAFDFSAPRDIVLFLIYFSILAFLCIRNNNIYTNIYLEWRKYRMYQCDLKCNILGREHIYESCLVLSKNDLTREIGNEIEYYDFDKDIYITF